MNSKSKLYHVHRNICKYRNRLLETSPVFESIKDDYLKEKDIFKQTSKYFFSDIDYNYVIDYSQVLRNLNTIENPKLYKSIKDKDLYSNPDTMFLDVLKANLLFKNKFNEDKDFLTMKNFDNDINTLRIIRMDMYERNYNKYDFLNFFESFLLINFFYINNFSNDIKSFNDDVLFYDILLFLNSLQKFQIFGKLNEDEIIYYTFCLNEIEYILSYYLNSLK